MVAQQNLHFVVCSLLARKVFKRVNIVILITVVQTFPKQSIPATHVQCSRLHQICKYTLAYWMK